MNNIQMIIEISTFPSALATSSKYDVFSMLYINFIYSHVSGAMQTPNGLNKESRKELHN
jgi:hypothetical protein